MSEREATISFFEDGAVEFTRNPETLKLFENEPKSIIRMTEVLFDEEAQRFYIVFLTGPLKCSDFSWDQHEWLSKLPEFRWEGSSPPWHETDNPRVFFDSYEHAVEWELRIVDVLRRRGHSLHA